MSHERQSINKRARRVSYSDEEEEEEEEEEEDEEEEEEEEDEEELNESIGRLVVLERNTPHLDDVRFKLYIIPIGRIPRSFMRNQNS